MTSEPRVIESTQFVPPRVGMLATVRNRRGVVSSVEPFAGRSSELLHLVTIEFSDADGDAEETLLWEREQQPVLLGVPLFSVPKVTVRIPSTGAGAVW